MPDVQFQEDTFTSQPTYTVGNSNPTGLMGLLIRMKLAKDEREASTILIAIGVLAVGATGFLLLQNLHLGVSKIPPPPPTGYVPSS